jgi:GTP cyclohydrolase II
MRSRLVFKYCSLKGLRPTVMLDHLKVKEVKLITNNPLKIQALKDQGINVVGRVQMIKHNATHVITACISR